MAWANYFSIEKIARDSRAKNLNKLTPEEKGGKPDILTFNNHNLYEIKPDTPGNEEKAQKEAMDYLKSLRKAGLCDTNLGPSNAPFAHGSLNLKRGRLTWRSPRPGVILYRWEGYRKPEEGEAALSNADQKAIAKAAEAAWPTPAAANPNAPGIGAEPAGTLHPGDPGYDQWLKREQETELEEWLEEQAAEGWKEAA
jgi:hypothetical protein